jgi:hypothetical protein
MNMELNIYGVYVPSLVIWSVVAYVLTRIIQAVLVKRKVYRSDIEQQICDVSFFVILVSIFSLVF